MRAWILAVLNMLLWGFIVFKTLTYAFDPALIEERVDSGPAPCCECVVVE